jgi:hypothetical protein
LKTDNDPEVRMARRRRRDALTVGLIACAVVVWLTATYFFVAGPRGVLGSDAPSASAEPPPAPPSVTASSRPAASTLPRVEDVNKCVTALLAGDSFKEPPNFEFVCKEADPVKGCGDIKTAIVKGAGGQTTPAMREWVKLGWYDMLAYSLIRTRCCASPPALTWSFEIACPVDKPLKRFEKIVRTRDTASLEKVMFDYAEEIRCLSRFGQAPNFKQGAPPGQGMESITKLLERAEMGPPQ